MKGGDESLIVESTFIGAKGDLADKSDIYGIWFRGTTTPSRSNILIDVSFNEGLAGEILPDNRIVKSPESLSPISSGLDMLKMYIPHIHSETAKIDNINIVNPYIDRFVLKKFKQKIFDWSSTTAAGFLSGASPNHILISTVNGANRAIYLPKTNESIGKFFQIERLFDGFPANFVNIRLNTTEGGSVLFKLYEGDRYFVYNLNGEWKWHIQNTVSKSSNSDLEIKNHDLNFPNSANGIILTDRTTGSKYRLFIDNGVLGTEVV
ncbi:hypothetical protein [Persephonella sp.]